jgi:hypothetical protein
MPTNRVAVLARRAGRAALAPTRIVHARIVARLAAQDAAARAHGWTVETLPRGGRAYRDPRFDQLAHRGNRPVRAGREGFR